MASLLLALAHPGHGIEAPHVHGEPWFCVAALVFSALVLVLLSSRSRS